MPGYLLIAVALIPGVLVVWGVVRFLRRLNSTGAKLIAWSFTLAVVIGVLQEVAHSLLARGASVLVDTLLGPVFWALNVACGIGVLMTIRSAFMRWANPAPPEQALQPDASASVHNAKE